MFLSPLVGVPNPHLVRNCNYNLCTRNGYLNVYPLRHEVQVPINHNLGDGSQVEGMPGSETLRRAKKEVLGYYPYSDFMNEENEHVFCKKCGSSLWVDTRGGEEKAKEMRKEEVKDIVAVNVSRILPPFFGRILLSAIRENKNELSGRKRGILECCEEL